MSETVAARQPTVLFVEDEPSLHTVMAEELAEAGYRVLGAKTGVEALGILRARASELDLLFTDIRLPDALSGWHVAFEFRFHHPLKPVVYATAYATTLEQQVFGSVLIRKPYRPSQVLAAFETLRRDVAVAQ